MNITTNGTLINKVREMLIAKPAIRQINFSLQSFDGNKVKESKEKYIANILSFVNEALNKSKIIIALRLWDLDKNNEINLKRENNEILKYIEKEFSYLIKYRKNHSEEVIS